MIINRHESETVTVSDGFGEDEVFVTVTPWVGTSNKGVDIYVGRKHENKSFALENKEVNALLVALAEVDYVTPSEAYND
jgi:hypothetical protein